jgi:PST family polysaccharide transporter
MMSADALGYYSNAYQLMVAPVNLIGQSLNIVLFPALASVQTDLIKVKKAYYKSIQLVAYASFIISSVLFINANEIVLIVLGKGWLDVIIPFQILAVATVFRMTSKIGDSLITAMGDEFRRAIIQIIYAICIIIFSYIGHFWGIEGVAIGVLIAIFFNFLLMTHLSLLQFKGNWRNFMAIYIKPFVFSVVVFTFSYVVLFVLRSFHLNLIITEIIYLLLVLGFLVIVTLRFKNVLGISNEIDSILSKIFKK